MGTFMANGHRKNKSGASSDASLAKVMALLERRWQREADRVKAIARTTEKPMTKRILAFHGGSDKQADDLAQIISEAGYPNTVSYYQASPLVTEVMLNGADAVVCWYDEKQPAAIRALEHLLEYRDRELPRILVLYPGENALNRLVQNHAHLFFDMLLEFARGRDLFRSALRKLFAQETMGEESATHLLRKLRSSSLSLRAAESFTAKLRSKPGKEYWARAEFIPHLIRAQEYPRAMEEALTLRKDSNQAFDYILLEHCIRRARSSRDFDGDSFVAEVIQSPFLTLPRIYTAARLLYRWRRPGALRKLLDFWDAASNLASDEHFHHAQSTYYRMRSMPQMEWEHIILAVQAQPLTATFLEVAATNLADQGEFLIANEFIRYAMGAGTLDEKRLTLTLAKNLVKAGRAKQAAKLMETLIRENPSYEIGRRVYRRLFNSFLDVS